MTARGNRIAFALIAIAGLGFALSLRAQQPPAQPPEQDPSNTEPVGNIHVLSNLVETPVTVTDSRGDFVYDLTEKDFEIFDDGVPQRIQNFEPETRPLAVVILIQTSRSVAPLLLQLQPLAPVFSELLLGPQGRAAVVTYSDRVRVEQEFSNSSDQLDTTLKALREGGDSARLNDALARALALLEHRPKSERRVIMAFADGFDTGSETKVDDILARATSDEVTIYGLGFSRTQAMFKQKPEASAPSALDNQITRPVGPNTIPTPTNEQNVWSTPGAGTAVLGAASAALRSIATGTLLGDYAAYTGGVFYGHWSEKTLQDQLARMASEIHSQYDLAYVPGDVRQPGFHRIVVRVARAGVKVRARAGYYYSPGKQ